MGGVLREDEPAREVQRLCADTYGQFADLHLCQDDIID
jgi:hypothetical protein